MMDQTTGGDAIGGALVDASVEALFGVHGYINPAIEAAARGGASVYHFRHEQSAGFAADAYARTLRRPGVCFASASAGHANYLPALSQAFGALSPVVLLVGQHGTAGDRLNILQEGYAVENLKSVAKWTHRVTHPAMNAHWVARALREAVSYPPGPVVLEFPLDNLARRFDGPSRKWLPAARAPQVPATGPDPSDVEAAADLLLRAEKPLIVAGDGVYWSDGVSELRALSELLKIPTGARRTARGAMPEGHRLGHGAATRARLLHQADLVCLVGLRASELEGWFEPPDWPTATQYLQINETPDEIWYGLPSAVTMAGSSRVALRAIREHVERALAAGQDRSSLLADRGRERWLTLADDAGSASRARLRDREGMPPPPGYDISTSALAHAIADVMDADATVIFDSYTGSLYLTDAVEATRPGQVLDAGPRVALGQGLGMCAGALIARPGTQAVTLVGDGGIGIAGMDMETLVRYGLPGIVVVHNNSSWGGTSLRQDLFHPDLSSWDLSRDIAYDAVFEPLGVHTESVKDPASLRPALQRAAESGRPSLVDVRADDGSRIVSDPWMRLKITDIVARGLDAYPAEAIEMFRTLSPRAAARLRKSCLDNGVDASLELISELTGVPLEELAEVPIGH